MKRLIRCLSVLLILSLALGLCSCAKITNFVLDLLPDSLLGINRNSEQPEDDVAPPPVPGGTTYPVETDPNAPPPPDIEFEDLATVEAISTSLDTVLYNGAMALEEEIDVSSFGLTADTIKQPMTQFLLLHPDLFYVGTQYSMSTNSSTGIVQRVALTYLNTASEVSAMRSTYNAAVNAIVSGIPSGATEFDKILYLHDYLVQNYCYDYEGLNNEKENREKKARGETPDKRNAYRDAYHFFTERTGVCQAYALALMATARAAGLECLPVVSEPIQHAWNLVKIDGAWYHIDVTWDDPGGWDEVHETPVPVYPTYTSYENFLLSDEALFRSDELRQKGWDATYNANTTTYDNVAWRTADTPLLRQGDVYYCMLYDTSGVGAGHMALYGGTLTEMTSVYDFPVGGWGYRAAWSTLLDYKGMILLNTAHSLCLYDTELGILHQLTDLETALEGKKIYGICSLEDGLVTYIVAEDYMGEYSTRTYQIPV